MTGAFLTAVLLALAVSCGGSEEPGETVLRLKADLSPLPADADKDAAMRDLQGKVQLRLIAYGSATIQATDIDGTDKIFVRVSGVEPDALRSMLTARGTLEFRGPQVLESGLVLCTASDGQTFGVPPNQVNPDEDSASLARCFGQDRVGEPTWVPIEVERDDGTTAMLSGDMVLPNGWELREDGTVLVANFSPEGADLLEATTTLLEGYPLGLFLDGELIAAPRINRAITDGRPFFSGFDADRGRILYAQLISGPYPVPVREEPVAP